MSNQIAAVWIVALICVAVVLSKWLAEIYSHRNHLRENWKLQLLESRVKEIEKRAPTQDPA